MDKKKILVDSNTFELNVIDKLIEQKLALKEFTKKAEENDVYVVQPDDITTTEVRTDGSRFFPEVKDGIVVGGVFK